MQRSHKYKTIHLHQQNVGHIVINGTTIASLTLMGNLKDEGTCEAVTYIEDGHRWTHVVVIASIKIHAHEYLAHVKLDSNEITVTSGVVCPYLNGYCVDSKFGETVWIILRKSVVKRGSLSFMKERPNSLEQKRTKNIL